MTTEVLGIADSFLPDFDTAGDKKRLYLSYRLCAFGRDEAMELAGISRRTLYHWRQKDPEFDKIEKTTLPELRDTFTKGIIYWQYVRNLRRVMALDGEVLDKALKGRETLTRREWARLKSISGKYDKSGLADVKLG